jgi:hypothetical protein
MQFPGLSELAERLAALEFVRKVLGEEVLLGDMAIGSLQRAAWQRSRVKPEQALQAASEIFALYAELIDEARGRARRKFSDHPVPRVRPEWLRVDHRTGGDHLWVALGASGWGLGFELSYDSQQRAAGGYRLAMHWLTGGPVSDDLRDNRAAIQNTVAWLGTGGESALTDDQIASLASAAGMPIGVAGVWMSIYDHSLSAEADPDGWLAKARELRQT